MLCSQIIMRSRLLRSVERIALRTLVVGMCFAGIWSSWKVARADYEFRRDTEESVHTAIRLVPDGWMYYMRLAQFDRTDARELLEQSLRLNRYDAQADIELALQYESEGDFRSAEEFFEEAFEVDHTYLPRWSLANFYFRRNNLPAFWAWARSAADMPSDNIGPLFELCWRVSPDPENVSRAILNDKPELIRQYLGFLLAKDQMQAAGSVAPFLIRQGAAETDRSLLFDVINQLVSHNDTDQAVALWKSLIEKRWIVADATVPNNSSFLREPLPVSFDWLLPAFSGLHSWPGSSGLQTEFTGSEPEDCFVAEQFVVLSPGNYAMTYSYQTAEIAPATGLSWQIIDARSERVLAASPDLSSEMATNSTLMFSVPPESGLLRLRLAYRRALGTSRIAGTLALKSTRIEAQT